MALLTGDWRWKVIEPFPEDSPEAGEILARARRLQESADRAFTRWFEGDVRSPSGAASLRSKAEEAWADVRLYVENGPEIESRESR